MFGNKKERHNVKFRFYQYVNRKNIYYFSVMINNMQALHVGSMYSPILYSYCWFEPYRQSVVDWITVQFLGLEVFQLVFYWLYIELLN